MKVICGDMEFGNFTPNNVVNDVSPVCLVHKVKAVLLLPDNYKHYNLDTLVSKVGFEAAFDSYIVVSGSPDYEIYYAKDAWEEIGEQLI